MDVFTMEPMKLAKQMIDFQKATFDNTFDAMAMLQDQTERTAASWEQTLGIPEEGQKFIDEWIKAFNERRDNFKKMVNESVDNMEAVPVEPEKEKAAKSR